MKKIYMLFVFLVLMIVISSNAVFAVSVTGVILNKTTLTLDKDTSETLIATVLPIDATNKTVTWASYNNDVATVNSSGLVTAVGVGICAITVTTLDGEYVGWCVVTVPYIPVTGISFNKSTASINIGSFETLVATVSPSNAANKNVNWSSYNNAVATVDNNGKVTGAGEGICAITATTIDGEYVAWCVVTVTAPGLGEMIWIPAGNFDMGTPDNYTGIHSKTEHPRHTVYLEGYWIGKYEVTRGEYQQFMDAGGYTNPSFWSVDGWNWNVSNNRVEPQYWAETQEWGTGTITQTQNHPVVGVTYYEAEAFCNWAGGHLPTEAQWERAARWTGIKANLFPWGDLWNQEFCNNLNDSNPAGGGYGKWQTAPVGIYPISASPSGCLDMAGNVWELCQDWFMSYPDSTIPFNYTNIYRVLRGGGWETSYIGSFLCARRDYITPRGFGPNQGFRLAR